MEFSKLKLLMENIFQGRHLQLSSSKLVLQKLFKSQITYTIHIQYNIGVGAQSTLGGTKFCRKNMY